MDAAPTETEYGSAPKEAAFDGAATPLRKAAMAGTLWIGIGTAATYVLRVVSSVVLARLIAPSVFGMMDLVMTFMVGLGLFSDIGLAASVTQNKHGEDERFVQTAWTLQVLRGGLLAIGACALAVPASLAYQRPVLAQVLPLMGLLPLAEGFFSPGSLLFQRRIQRKQLVALELAGSVTVLITTIFGVYLAYPAECHAVLEGKLETLPRDDNLVWAIAVAWILGRGASLIASYLVAPKPRVRFVLHKESAREILSFGKWIFLSTLLTYVATQSDRLLLPKLVGFDAIGLYARALALLAAGTGIIGQLQSQIVFPACRRLLERGHPTQEVFVAVHRVVALASAVVVTGALASGPSLARGLYPSTYNGVDVLVQWVAASAWFQLLGGHVSAFLLAADKRRSFVLPGLVKAVAVVLFVVPTWWLVGATPLGPLIGVVLGLLLADTVAYSAAVAVGWRHGLPMLRADALQSLGVVVFALLARYGGEALVDGFASGRWGHLLLFVAQGTLSVLPWAAVAWAMHRKRTLLRIG